MTHTPRASPSVPAYGVTLVVMPMFLSSYRYLVMGSSSELHYFSSTSGHIWHVSLLGLRTILLAKDDAKSSSFPLWSFFFGHCDHTRGHCCKAAEAGISGGGPSVVSEAHPVPKGPPLKFPSSKVRRGGRLLSPPPGHIVTPVLLDTVWDLHPLICSISHLAWGLQSISVMAQGESLGLGLGIRQMLYYSPSLLSSFSPPPPF